MADEKKPFVFISAYAKGRGMSISDLAKSLSITPRTLNNKINRKSSFTMDQALALSETLGVPAGELFRT